MLRSEEADPCRREVTVTHTPDPRSAGRRRTENPGGSAGQSAPESAGTAIAQLPNLPLWIFLATVVLRRVVPARTWVRTAINWTAVVALGWWALDESLRGVNPWRRALGLGVGGLVVALGAYSSRAMAGGCPMSSKVLLPPS